MAKTATPIKIDRTTAIPAITKVLIARLSEHPPVGELAESVFNELAALQGEQSAQ